MVPEQLYLPLVASGVLLLSTLVVGYKYVSERRKLEETVNELVGDTEANLSAPAIGSSKAGLISTWRHRSKAKKLARKGYVKWYKIGASMSAPQWVKPTADGAGVLEYYDKEDEVTYLFPTGAMVNDESTGAYVAVHREGEAEPINLRDPAMPPIPADRLEEIINLEAESDAPSMFDRMDLDPQTLLWVGIAGMLILAGASRFMG